MALSPAQTDEAPPWTQFQKSAAPADNTPEITVRPTPQKPVGEGPWSAFQGQAKGASPPPSSGFSVTPPPPDKAPIVEAAAKQYNVPLNVAHFVGSRESGWRDDALGIPTSSGRARGAWQFMDDTAKQYGLADPSDFKTATPAAMHKLADLAAKNGGDWEKAVAQYGTFSTGQGAEKDAAVRQAYRDYMGIKPPEPTMAGDIARGTARGLTKGVDSLLGLPFDVLSLLDRGSVWVIARGLEKSGAITPELADRVIASQDQRSYGPITSENINNATMGLLDRAGVTAPETTPGQYAETIGSFLPGAATAGVIGGAARAIPGALVKYGLVPGVASETAGQLTQGTELEPYARAAGAIVGSGPALVADIAKARSVAATARTMRNADPAHLAAAQSLVDEARAAGAPLTLPEALKYASQGATDLTGVQRIVEQSPGGSPAMSAFYAQRPAQTEQLGRGAMGAVAPVPADPFQTAPLVQRAATTAVNATPEAAGLRASVDSLGAPATAEEAGNVIRPELQNVYDRREGMRAGLADRDYGEARAADYGPNGAPANPVRVQAVIAHVDDLLASAKGGVAAALRRARGTLFSNGQPDMSVTGLSNARNAINDQIDQATRTGNRQAAGALQDVLGQLDYALENVPAYGQARRNFAAASEPLRPFAPETVPGRIIHQDQYGRAYTMPTEQVAPSLEKSGATGIDQFLAAAENSPAARQAFGQYYAQRLLQSATDSAGRISPDILGNALRQSADMLRRFPEIEARLNTVAAARRALAEIETTPLGALAASTGITGETQLSAQRAIMFNPTEAAPHGQETIARTIRAVAAHDPEAAAQFVRAHIETVFNEATQENMTGPNQWGGPKFAAVLKGNPQQLENIEAAMRALPQGDLRWNSFRSALRIMEAQGARPVAGSQTDMNAVIRSELKKGTPVGEIVATAGSPTRGLKWISEAYDNFMYHRNTAELARVFTSGNVDDLREIALRAPGSFRARAALVTALSREQGARSGEPEGYASGGGVDADPTGNSMLRGMPRPIEQSPDWGAAYSSSIDAVKAARAESVRQGLLDPDTGMPTKAGLVDAAKQYANGMLMGSTAPRSPHFALDPYDLKAADNLTPHQQGAVDHYASGSSFLNGDSPEAEGLRRHLDAAIDASRLSDNARLYRGFSVPREHIEQIKPGDVVPLSTGYVSTTTNKDVARNYANDDTGGDASVLAELRVPRDHPALHIPTEELVESELGANHEILLPRNTRFRVHSLSEKSNGRYEMLAVPEPQGQRGASGRSRGGALSGKSGYARLIAERFR